MLKPKAVANENKPVLMAKTQAIPWKRILVEGTAIVLSILLAFAIDAWWDGRKDRLEEKEILVGLEVEFVDLRSRLDEWAGFNRAGAQFVDRYLSDAVTEMSLREIETVFTYVSLTNVLDQGGALDALLASGRLEKVGDRNIRALLLKWPDWLDDIHTNDLSSRSYVMREIVPFLAKRGFPRKTCESPKFFLICSVSGPVHSEYILLANNPEFRAILIYHRAWMLAKAVDHELARDEADKLLGLLRDGIEKSGI